MGKRLFFWCVCLVAILIGPHPRSNALDNTPVHASNGSSGETVVVHFTAEVTLISDPWMYLNVDIGDIMYGTYIYETGPSDQDPSPRVGIYNYNAAPARMRIDIRDYAFRSDPNNIDFYIVVQDSVDSQALDQYSASEWNVVEMNGNLPFVVYMGIQLRDSSGVALNSDLLPTEAPDLDDWPHKRQVEINSGDWLIRARVISISEGEIPLLSTRMMVVLVLSLLLLGILWLKRARSHRNSTGFERP